MKDVLKYWMLWNITKIVFVHKYTYAWYKGAYRIAICKYEQNKESVCIKAKYRLLALHHEGWDQYMALKNAENKELNESYSNINKKHFSFLN